MNVLAMTGNRLSLLRRVVDVRAHPLTLAPALVVIVLLKLAISDGGRDTLSLTIAQIAIFIPLALLVRTGLLRWSGVGRAMLIMIGVMALGTLISVRPASSVRELLLWTMYLGIVVVTGSTLYGRDAARRLLDGLVAIAGWLVLIALFMFWGNGNPQLRWYSTFYWPNPFAAFLLLVLPLELVRLARARHGRESLMHGALTVLLGVAVVMTYSRGAWLSLGVVLILTPVLLRPPSWRSAVVRCISVAVLIGGAIILLTRGGGLSGAGQGITSRAASIADTGDVSVQGRLHFWRAAGAIFADHPWLGTGPGTFGAVHARYQRDVRFYARDAHNLYMQTLAEGGIAGALALVGVVAMAARLWLRALQRSSGDDYTLLLGSGLGLAAFFIHSGVDMDWAFPANPVMAFALIGVIVWFDQTSRPGGVAVTRNEATGAWWRRISVARPWVRAGSAAALTAAMLVTVASYTAHHAYVTGLAHQRSGRWEHAFISYRAAVARNPLHPEYYARAGFAAFQLPGRGALASFYLQTAMALDRANASHPLMLAYITSTRPGAAADEVAGWLRHALQLDPVNRPEAYRLLADTYLQSGRRALAMGIYKEAIALYSGHRVAGGMAHVLLWPEIATLFEAASSVLASEGRIAESMALLERVIRDDPSWAPAYVRLASLHWRTGERARAREILEQGLRHNPASELLWMARQTQGMPRSARYER